MRRALVFVAIASACAVPLACRQILDIKEVVVDAGEDAGDVDALPPPPNPPPPPPPVDAGSDADADAPITHTECVQSCVKDAGTATAADYFEGPSDSTYNCLCGATECSADCTSYCQDKKNGRTDTCTNCMVGRLNDMGSMCFTGRCATQPCVALNDCFVGCPSP